MARCVRINGTTSMAIFLKILITAKGCGTILLLGFDSRGAKQTSPTKII
jgi:hypothetical protein